MFLFCHKTSKKVVNTDLCSAAHNPELFFFYLCIKATIVKYVIQGIFVDRKLIFFNGYISEDRDWVTYFIEKREKSRRAHLCN